MRPVEGEPPPPPPSSLGLFSFETRWLCAAVLPPEEGGEALATFLQERPPLVVARLLAARSPGHGPAAPRTDATQPALASSSASARFCLFFLFRSSICSCSLVVVDAGDRAVPISRGGDGRVNRCCCGSVSGLSPPRLGGEREVPGPSGTPPVPPRLARRSVLCAASGGEDEAPPTTELEFSPRELRVPRRRPVRGVDDVEVGEDDADNGGNLSGP